MNLYLLENYTNEGYNTYDSCLVVAADEKSARLIKPDESRWGEEYSYSRSGWCMKPEDVIVKYIGVASEDLEENSILISSFNAA